MADHTFWMILAEFDLTPFRVEPFVADEALAYSLKGTALMHQLSLIRGSIMLSEYILIAPRACSHPNLSRTRLVIKSALVHNDLLRDESVAGCAFDALGVIGLRGFEVGAGKD
jgi:hypothetical protein